MDQVIRQHQWTEAELLAEGFQHYERRKELVMAGRLPPNRAPLELRYTLETVIAETGDVICFEPGAELRSSLYDYEHWSVKPDIFRETYRRWDATDWHPSPTERHLMRYGCRPYFKHAGVWAKRLTGPVYIQSLESPKPALIPAGVWLTIGVKGEPWHISTEKFVSRYVVPDEAPPRRSRFAWRSGLAGILQSLLRTG